MKNNKRIRVILILSLVFVVALLSFTMVACKNTSESYKVAFAVEKAEYGSVSATINSGDKVEEGTSVTLTATPTDDGYEFVGWYVENDLKSSDNPYEFKVAEDISLIAKFEELWHHHAYTEHVSYSKYEEEENDEFVIYRTMKCSCGQTQTTEFTDYTLIDDSYNLRIALKSTGVKNRLLVLNNGWAFGYLELGLDYFDEGLTIIGKSGTSMNGLMINSGKGFNNANASTDVMPSRVTIMGIEFTGDLHVVNCSMDKLTIKDCTFIDGSGINIRANSWTGADENTARPLYQRNTISNTVIENCTFSTQANVENKTKINLFDINGVTVKNNSISGCDFNAIQLNSRSNDGVYGDIVIEGNQISDTYSRAIRITNIKGNITIKDNAFAYIDGSGSNNGEVIKASSKENSTIVVFTGNTLNGNSIAVDDAKVVGLN